MKGFAKNIKSNGYKTTFTDNSPGMARIGKRTNKIKKDIQNDNTQTKIQDKIFKNG